MQKFNKGDWVHCNFRDEEGIVVRDHSPPEGYSHWVSSHRVWVLFVGRTTPVKSLGFDLLVLERAEDNKNEN